MHDTTNSRMNINISCFVLFIIFVFPENMFISSFIEFVHCIVRRFFPEHVCCYIFVCGYFLMMYDKKQLT